MDCVVTKVCVIWRLSTLATLVEFFLPDQQRSLSKPPTATGRPRWPGVQGGHGSGGRYGVRLPNLQRTLNELPPELRRQKFFFEQHRLSMQVGGQNVRKKTRRACNVRAFRPSFPFCVPPLVVGQGQHDFDTVVASHLFLSSCISSLLTFFLDPPLCR